jgi:enoyl-CoA hydratase
MTDPVVVERAGPVTTVLLNRPAVRNAVDGPTAGALADAFRAFDADPGAAVAILTGTPAATAPSPPETPEYVDNFREQA